jgi:hypothetical protein
MSFLYYDSGNLQKSESLYDNSGNLKTWLGKSCVELSVLVHLECYTAACSKYLDRFPFAQLPCIYDRVHLRQYRLCRSKLSQYCELHDLLTATSGDLEKSERFCAEKC